jgi:hypothetical protein
VDPDDQPRTGDTRTAGVGPGADAPDELTPEELTSDELTPPGGWPSIADYWPDAPQRMGPPADMHEDPAAAPTRIGAAWQEPAVRAAVLGRPATPRTARRAGRVLGGAGLAVLLLLGGGFIAYRKVAQESRPEGAPPAARPPVTVPAAPSGAMGPVTLLPEPSPSSPPPVTPSVRARKQEPARPDKGTFTLVDDVSDITVRTARLDSGIVQVAVPDGSSAAPRTTVDGGAVRLRVDKKGRNSDLVVRLDDRVSWAIRLGGGARTMTVDLGGADVRSVAFEGGAARIDLTLPRLDDTLPISLNGGVNRWRITTQGRVAVQVLARRGGGDVVLYGRDRGGLDRGDRVRAGDGDGIDVTATAGFGSLTVAGG